MNLILKFHPKHLAYYLNKDLYGIIPVETNLNVTGDRVRQVLEEVTQEIKIENIVVEKPFLRLLGNADERKTLAKHIIHVQRTFGVILYIVHMLFRGVPQAHISSKIARDTIYKRDISKDTQLSEASALLNNCQAFSPLTLLSLHDCLVMNRYFKENLNG